MVFKTAYETNENLLICAPTGAGKTNIAMLTVVHQIRQHIDKGVIQRDAFKVSLGGRGGVREEGSGPLGWVG